MSNCCTIGEGRSSINSRCEVLTSVRPDPGNYTLYSEVLYCHEPTPQAKGGPRQPPEAQDALPTSLAFLSDSATSRARARQVGLAEFDL